MGPMYVLAEVPQSHVSYHTLHHAIQDNDVDVIRALLNDSNTDVNCIDDDFRTPLHYAVTYCNREAVALLLAHKDTDVNCGDLVWWTPLHHAVNAEASADRIEIIQLLLNHPHIDVNISSSGFQTTPLILAIENGNIEAVRLLLSHAHIDVNKTDEHHPPIEKAYQSNQQEIISLLMNHPAIQMIPFDLYYNGSLFTDECVRIVLTVEQWGADEGECIINLSDCSYQKNQNTKEVDQYDLVECDFSWTYLGSLDTNHHIIVGYYTWYCTRTYDDIRVAVIKRIGDTLIRTSIIMGEWCKTVESRDGALFYSLPMTNGDFIEEVCVLYPEIAPLYDRSSKRGLYYSYGNSNYFCDPDGYCTYRVPFTPDGRIGTQTIEYFDTVKDWKIYDRIEKDGFKEYALQILRDIDKDIPDDLKEDGVAYSPECFFQLIEDDIRNKNLGTKKVLINAYKDEPSVGRSYTEYGTFQWDYIGQYSNYYCIYVNCNDIFDDCQNGAGLYLIAKENEYLKKITRLAYSKEGLPLLISGEYETPPKEAFSLVGNVLTYQMKLYNKHCVEYLVKPVVSCIEEKNYTINDPDDYCGTIKMAIVLAEDGSIIQQAVVGFLPHPCHCDDLCMMIESGDPLSINQAIRYYACTDMSHCWDRYTYIKGDNVYTLIENALRIAQQKNNDV